MLPKLIRLTLVLAAVAAGVGVFGPASHRALCVDLAMVLAASAFLSWRAHAALRSRLEHRSAATTPLRLLTEDAHREHVETRLAEIAESPSFETRLCRTGELLRNELGARDLHIYTVDRMNGRERLVERVAGPHGIKLPIAASTASNGPAARALIGRCLCADLPRALAVPLLDGAGRVAAVLELASLEIDIDGGALRHLLERAHAAVAGVDAPGSATSGAARVEPAPHSGGGAAAPFLDAARA